MPPMATDYFSFYYCFLFSIQSFNHHIYRFFNAIFESNIVGIVEKKPGSSNNNAIMLPYLKGEKCSPNSDHNGFFGLQLNGAK